ncbi:hypothetical protein DdX_09727 [Ditylenchus destructor]|uniref:Uncharacterized protein n=1 Tax=Ditylenchus destructor TaxID=166010 RepID=A0AAD4R2V5_9BILA|nr:hypothetical protein DdX_09727 [Ditylenchus destructor]
MPNRNCKRDNKYFDGIVLATDSDDFPYVVFLGNKLPVYLFPDSIQYVGEQTAETKSMKSRMKERMLDGHAVTFKVDCKGIVSTYIRNRKDYGAEIYKNYATVIAEAVFSPDVPCQCYVRTFGIVSYSVDTSRLVPNLVYNVRLALIPLLVCPDKDNCLPQPRVIYEVVSVKEPIFRLDTLYEAPWITEDNRVLYYLEDGGVKFKKSEWDIKLKFAKIYGVALGNGQILWKEQPLHKVRIALPRDDDDKYILFPGANIKAYRLVFHTYHGYYVARDYKVEKEKKAVTTKYLLIDNDMKLVYKVELNRSQWSDFFTAKEFGKYCLVDDPSLFLINAQVERINFPAWVFYKNDDGSVSKFTVASIEEKDYTMQEYYSNVPFIHGTGFLVNNRTGSVFSENHPLKRILLMMPDRSSIQVGDYFNFEAFYFVPKDSFVVIRLKPSKQRHFNGKIIPWRNTFLFETNLDCGEFRASRKVYPSIDLGLVTDTEGIITTRASMKNAHMRVTAFIEENTDYNRSTFFNVYKVSLSEKEIELEKPSRPTAPTKDWWQGKTPKSCLCRKTTEILREVLNIPDVSQLWMRQTWILSGIKHSRFPLAWELETPLDGPQACSPFYMSIHHSLIGPKPRDVLANTNRKHGKIPVVSLRFCFVGA